MLCQLTDPVYSVLINLRDAQRACGRADPLVFIFGYIVNGSKSLYGVLLHNIVGCWNGMNVNTKREEIRWQVIRAMLDEFPNLKEKVRTYLKEQKSKQ